MGSTRDTIPVPVTIPLSPDVVVVAAAADSILLSTDVALADSNDIPTAVPLSTDVAVDCNFGIKIKHKITLIKMDYQKYRVPASHHLWHQNSTKNYKSITRMVCCILPHHFEIVM